MVPKAVVGLTLALIVIVTEPPLGRLPSQLTLLLARSAAAVPDVALTETKAKPGGRTSTNSGPELSPWISVPLLVSLMV